MRLPGALQEARIRREPKKTLIVTHGHQNPNGGHPSLYIHPKIEALSRNNPNEYTRVLNATADLVEKIELGHEITSNHYRRSVGRDRLLYGPLCVMHLHVIHPGDDYLLYLIQFPGYIALIALGPHVFMEGHPPGRLFPFLQIKRMAEEISKSITSTPQPESEVEDDGSAEFYGISGSR